MMKGHSVYLNETLCRLGGVKTPISHLNVKEMMEDIPYLTHQGGLRPKSLMK